MNQRIFVFEFITGGGLAGQPLPASLAREGRLMRDTLLRDAADIAGAGLVTLHDARLEAPLPGSIAVTDADAFDAAFGAALAGADAALVVAPETGDLLATLAARVEASGTRLLGGDAASCRVAASKSRTARVLAEAGVAVLPHYSDAGALPDVLGAWAVKPDDGAGCDGLLRLSDRTAAARALRAAGPDHIAQPWLDGEARSMNLLCARGRAALLSVNGQRLEHRGERVRLAALAVGAVDATPQHAALAQRIAAALPGLLGPVGVDFIETKDGPVVVEINPRMSTSACALRDATGLNLVAATLAAARDGRLPSAAPARPHTLTLEAHEETV
ncbi:MAG: ATP-grasp domain-containing protein [Methyloversatilis sp.]|jgi:predicted ATP-grasp superfamily ATP-dependent carboligase|nr:ATP-grasp domain-containing protein [Methyloversatilis sp.]